VNFFLPRATTKVFADLHLFFSLFPFSKGEKMKGILPRAPKNSPPLEKGRSGGISGKALS
jgi:hypothetical protein